MKVPKVNFSYKYSRGSCTERVKKIQALNGIIFNNAVSLYNQTGKNVSIRALEALYKMNLPETLFCSVKKNADKNNHNARLCTSYAINRFSGKRRVLGYTIEVPSKQNSLSLSSLPLFMHESAHLLDHAINPKFNKYQAEIMNDTNLRKNIDKFYMENCYDSNFSMPFSAKKMKQKTRQLIKQLDSGTKIKVLNYIKLNLLSEKIGYGEQIKYQGIMQTRGQADGLESLIKLVIGFHFDEKIDVIESLLKEIIREERYKLAQKNAKTSTDRLKIAYSYYIKSRISN